MCSQFKFKPDKIKYLSTIDTLDSSHKKITNNINKKREDLPKKIKKLTKLREELDDLDKKCSELDNYIIIRSKLLDDIRYIEEELENIENYEDELEYYGKTHDILFNYYDIIDGYNKADYEKQEEIISVTENTEYSNTVSTSDIKDNNEELEIFNNSNMDKLELLNQMSKLKRKEKKTTRKRVKNVETLIKDNNNIFDYIEGKKNDINKIDRATLFEDYKVLLEGYPSQKKINKPCSLCGVDKVLIYSEGLYACMNCGEVENCIIESEATNYKDPMIEKPTFPYKRKNHFCEWIIRLFKLLVKVDIKHIC